MGLSCASFSSGLYQYRLDTLSKLQPAFLDWSTVISKEEMPSLFKALPYSFSLCQQFASMSMEGQISGNHSQMRRKVNSEAEVPPTGPGKIQYLKSVHVSHCTQCPLILLWEPCGSFIPGIDSWFFQALFLAAQLFNFNFTSAEVELRFIKPYSQATALGFLRLIYRMYRGGLQKCSGQSSARGHHILTSFRKELEYAHGYHGML